MELSHHGVNVTESDVDALAVVAERSTSVLAHIMAAKKPRASDPTRRLSSLSSYGSFSCILLCRAPDESSSLFGGTLHGVAPRARRHLLMMLGAHGRILARARKSAGAKLIKSL